MTREDITELFRTFTKYVLANTHLAPQVTDRSLNYYGDTFAWVRDRFMPALTAPVSSAAQPATDPFVEKHLSAIREKTMDAAISHIVNPMFGGLESASIKYFLETSSINGSFLMRLRQVYQAGQQDRLINAQPATGYSEERGHSTNPNVQEKASKGPPISAPEWLNKHNSGG